MHIPRPGADRRRIGTTSRNSFTVLEGEIEATFRGEKSMVHAG